VGVPLRNPGECPAVAVRETEFMRRTHRALLSSSMLATLALATAPVFATKPSQPPGQAKHAASEQAGSAKKQPAAAGSSHRGGPEKSASGKQAGFAAGNARPNQDRDNDRRDWQGNDHRDWHRDNDDRHDARQGRDWDRRDWDRGDWDRDRDRHDDRWSRKDWDRARYDRHDYVRYYYPRPGYVVRRLPSNFRVVNYYGAPYYFSGGSWYRPHGSLFTVVTPPLGLMISFLPDAYTTLWIGDIPYYRANDVYYRWRPDRRAYIVTALPPGYY
jgi:hypothetical protein